MQITSNTTGMLADLTVSTDKDGRDYCVVVIKGTFVVDRDGTVALAEDQHALVYADEHYGDPGRTSIKYECDFAPFKPQADVVANGFAFSPNGSPVREMRVGFQIGSVRKVIAVFGDRFWDRGPIGLRPSDPKPFIQMPLNYERAYGGSDKSPDDPAQWGSELRNPVGVGFYVGAGAGSVTGKPLPNLEDVQHAIRSWSDRPPPFSLGGLGRGWQPRIKHAGTYDQQWLDNRFPFLPADFDQRYFQSAPADQQLPYLTGGEVVRCANMTPDGAVTFVVPRIEIPVTYHFRDRSVAAEPRLDTLIVEPHQRRFIAAWRTATQLGRKVHALREVTVGCPPSVRPRRTATGRLHFGSISETIAWHKTQTSKDDGD
jgi:hypothetical protein